MTPEEIAARAARRVKNRSDRELVEWLDAALSGMMRHLDLYRRTDDAMHLDEMQVANVSAAAVLTELTLRHEAKRQEGLV